MLNECAYEYKCEKYDIAISMREFHINIHQILFQYVTNKQTGGYLSMRQPVSTHPIILVGQDKFVCK